MEIIKGLVQTLIIIVVLAVFLEMLLPTGKMTPYVKMVMGLMIIVAVLQAISGLLQQNWLQEIPNVTTRSGSPGPALDDIMAAGKSLQVKNEDLAIEQYRRGISGQVLALARMNPGVNVVDAEVKFSREPGEKGCGRITGITLIVDASEPEDDREYSDNDSEPITPVNIKIGEPEEREKNVTDSEVPAEIKNRAGEVARSVAGFYSLSPDKVSIEYKKV